MRKLASVQKIGKIIPIPNKDRIVQVMVNGWSVIAGKEQFNEGDLCVYFEIDSLLPDCNQLANVIKRGKRLKTMRLGGVLSQGLVINIDEAKCISAELGTKFPKEIDIDTDLTEVLKIEKWEASGDDGLRKSNSKQKGFLKKLIDKILFHKNVDDSFPTELGLNKTDEERVQNLMNQVEAWSDAKIEFRKTMKMDGQSTTWILKKKSFLVMTKGFERIMCSRNRTINKDSCDYERFYDVAKKTGIFGFLEGLYWRFMAYEWGYFGHHDKRLYDPNDSIDYIAVQAELCGPGIQKNRIKLDSPTLYIFNLIVKTKKGGVFKLCPHDFISVNLSNIKLVPDLGKTYIGKNIEWFYNDIRDYKYNEKSLAEGVVYRNYERDISFKCVNPDYLIKNDC